MLHTILRRIPLSRPYSLRSDLTHIPSPHTAPRASGRRRSSKADRDLHPLSFGRLRTVFDSFTYRVSPPYAPSLHPYVYIIYFRSFHSSSRLPSYRPRPIAICYGTPVLPASHLRDLIRYSALLESVLAPAFHSDSKRDWLLAQFRPPVPDRNAMSGHQN